jgi:hypothetical protein
MSERTSMSADPATPEAALSLFQELEKERQAALRLLGRADVALGSRQHMDPHDMRLWEDIREFLRDVP